ncbi:hypothetical protein [Mycobacterium syngnathidarum]|uniref:Uncharacterized protein n=1 Tax=Mycobacterium syngnathidarum TaxID=1908205 RepID=A0A1S1K7K1_9MYCO|nr:hypothetical protein BKG61_08745 [Mycobacterium syngnathidarum]
MESLEERATLSLLNVDQHIAGHSRIQGKRVVREPGFESQFANVLTYYLSALRPEFCTLRICLAESGWHATGTRQQRES